MLSLLICACVLDAQVKLSGPDNPVKINSRSAAVVAVPLKFRNLSREEVTLWGAGFFPNHRWVLRDQHGVAVPKTALGKIGDAAFDKAARDKNFPIRLPAGGTYAELTPDLKQSFVFKPGSYTLEIEYRESFAKTKLTLMTQKIKLIVVDVPGK